MVFLFAVYFRTRLRIIPVSVPTFSYGMSQPDSNEDQRPAEKPPRRWLSWLRDLALLALVFLAIQWWQSRDLARNDAPPLVGLQVDGTPLQLRQLDGPVLVHFWAEWCPICRLEQNSIDALAEDHQVVTIATTSGTSDEVQAFLLEHGLTMPTIVDEDGELARNWGVTGVPATFIVNSERRIAFASQGFSTGVGLRLRLWLTD